MSNYSFSEEGSEANVDEDLLRDLDNLREVLEEDDSAAAREEGGDVSSSLAERPLEGLKLCLQKNHENQVLLKWLLKKIDKALETNQLKREDSIYPSSSKKKKLTFWRFYSGSYFKNHVGRSAPSAEDARVPQSGPRNFYLTDNLWLSHREDVKLVEGLKMLAIEKRSYPLQEKLLDAKTSEERKALRRQIKALKDLSDKELLDDLEMSDNDWYSISYVQFSESKTMGDCRLRWENHLHPSIYRGPWSKEEEKRLVKVANQRQCTDWKAIAEEVGTKRAPIAYLKHYQELFRKSSLQIHQWTPEMDRLLKEAVSKYGQKNWRAVAYDVGHGVSHSQCLHRWFNSTNPTIKKGRWSEEEDELLKEALKIHGTKWSHVACMVPSRTATQCRERWVNVLDTNLNRGRWEPEEDQRLIDICRKYQGGSIPWAKVAQELGHRTDAMCSNRWRSLSSTPEVVQQYARRVTEKVLSKKNSHLSPNDIEQDMLPEACVQRVEEYKDRLVNFNARRRKSSIGLSPVTILLSRGVPVFPEDNRSTSSSSNARSTTASSLATTSRSAASGGRQRASSSSQRGASKSGIGGGRTRARKRKRGAESAAQDGGSGSAESAAQNEGDAKSAQTGDTGNEGEQRPPPRKKRAYRRRSQMQHGTSSYGQGSASVARQTTTTAHTTVNNGVGAVPDGHSDDMMQLTEQFAQQHYKNIVSQTTPTLHLLSQQQQQQQLAAYVPTSRSYLGIPIFVERDDAPASSIIHQQAQQLPESSSTTGQRTLSLLSTSHQLTRPSPTCTCASITSPSLSVSGVTSTTASQLTGVQVLPPPGLHMPHLHAYPLAAPSYALPFQGVYSFPQTSTSALTQSSQLQSTCSFPTTVSHNHSSAIAHPAHPHTLPSAPSTSSSLATASSSAAEVVDSSSSQSISLSSIAPIVSSQSQLHDSSLATASSSAAEVIDSSSSSQSTCISLSSTAPIVSSQSQLHVTYSFPRTQISQPYPATTTTEISPPTSMVSSPTVSASLTEASQSQDSTRGQQVSQGQTSVRNQAPTDEVVFPKGPSFITLVRHPGTVASLNRLKTVSSRSSSRSSSSSSSRRPNTSSGASSYVQPHASLLAPEFRQGNLSSVETATVRASASTGTSSTSVTTCTPTCTSARSSTSTTSVHETRPLIIGPAPHLSRRFGDIPYPSLGPRSLPPRSVSFTSVTDDSMPTRPWTPDTGRSSAGSPLNPDHPVGAAVSALLSLSDHTNSRSPSRFSTASPLPRMSLIPLRSSHYFTRSFTAATLSASNNTIVTPPRLNSTSRSESSPLTTTTMPTFVAGAGNGVRYTLSTTHSPDAPTIITTATSNSQPSSSVGSGSGAAAESTHSPSPPAIITTATQSPNAPAIVTTTTSSIQTSTSTSNGVVSGSGATAVRSTATHSPDTPAIITTTTSNSQTSSSVESISGAAAAERNTAATTATESRTRWEDADFVQVLAVPDAIHCSEDLSEESETMQLTQEPTVAVQKMDGPTLIGSQDSNNDIIVTAAETASRAEQESMESQAAEMSQTELLDRVSPRKQPRRGAAKTGRRSTTKRQTANSRRKS